MDKGVIEGCKDVADTKRRDSWTFLKLVSKIDARVSYTSDKMTIRPDHDDPLFFECYQREWG